jgi:uncharacterized protein YrrD
MLWSFDELKGFSLRATDGSLGSVHDLLFDDAHWTARWLVVDTAWLFGRRVLIAPQALGHPDGVAREFPVNLTKDQIKNAPDVDTDRPVNRQHEADLYGYYGYGPYWTTMDNALIGGVAGVTLPPRMPLGHPERLPANAAAESRAAGARYIDEGDPHLRSAREVIGYTIRGTDDSVGSVADFLIDEQGWAIRYLVVDTGNWLSGRKVLIAPPWVSEVSWATQEVQVTLTRAEIEASPEYNPDMALDRPYEEQLHGHYGRPGYW